jgi:diaminohydroxyphosphoribosylaminopyrimidine deaminase/5-amino-6-(5-phosphoribosylamino)uracil reductase
MGAALALSERGRGRTGPNPNVGCVLVKDGIIIGRGWTQPGGRPHAEAMALNEAGAAASGATAYVTLEPCAHDSKRGPACADSLIAAAVGRVVFALGDPDPRTNGKGADRLRAADIDVVELPSAKAAARRAMAPWLSVMERGRPFVTLKLATSLDGCIARADGESQWITGNAARAHGHLERARHDMILVGRGTYDADAPRLDVRLPGLEGESPRRALLTSGAAPEGWEALRSPEAIASLKEVQSILVEGGAQTASSFLKAGLVDRILHYHAPIIIGGGLPCLGDIGLSALAQAHGRWTRADTRSLGNDTLDVYEAI